MSQTKITIQIQNGGTLLDEHTIMLGASDMKKWKIADNQSVILQYGAFKKEVTVIPVARLNGIRLHEALAERLGLHQGIQLCMRYKPRMRMLRIGPLIGVLISRIYTKDSEKPFGAITSFCRELTDACAKFGAFTYFFIPDDIQSTPQIVHGWNFSGKWHKKTFPAPDVVYNRLTSRKLENKPDVQQFMTDVKTRFGSVVFNEKYLDKTEVFEALKKETSLHKYLPESYLFKNFPMLKSMMARHSTLFLKPITGSLGKGIIRISKIPNAEYLCSYNTLNGVVNKTFASLPLLFANISGKIKHSPYQIQQGLKLIEVNGNPVDFRVLVQRNGAGEWSVTSSVARTAGNDNFVSNLARGGTLGKVQEVVGRSDLSSAFKTNLNDKLSTAALQLAKGIETQIPSHFAELGIDLAADKFGKVWLIEVNSKPSKDDNTPLVENKIRPSVIRVVQYSQFLAGFK
jgi:hypothetical protein